MPKISQTKRDKISEHILHYLFTASPSAKFTAEISQEIARDEEFTKSILQDLEKKNLIIKVSKNPKGKPYLKRSRWLLSQQAHDAYSQHQTHSLP